MIVLKFQSVSDIITNSSSETFTLKSNIAYDTVRSMILAEHDKNAVDWDHYNDDTGKYDKPSGDGGRLKIKDWYDIYVEYRAYNCDKSKYDLYTPEVWALSFKESLDEIKSMIWIDIDQGFKPTINYILDNFWVVNSSMWEYYDIIDKKTNKVKTIPARFWQLDENTKEPIRVISRKMYESLPEEYRAIK